MHVAHRHPDVAVPRRAGMKPACAIAVVADHRELDHLKRRNRKTSKPQIRKLVCFTCLKDYGSYEDLHARVFEPT